ncbi:hypothetical protein SBA5_240002 [Candidatus Sulfotelmatomonas gaucii]|uniref:Uncharacterized protein n=1 Tax=Candidatus Sulfuritelmatomonas gaucii TaxID=2043161 RepID=A0A2N9L820_9BACT|nr:hypothetical protein SBA5_240002 [Candidatus Sulfotelmatomonas gaucii]
MRKQQNKRRRPAPRGFAYWPHVHAGGKNEPALFLIPEVWYLSAPIWSRESAESTRGKRTLKTRK